MFANLDQVLFFFCGVQRVGGGGGVQKNLQLKSTIAFQRLGKKDHLIAGHTLFCSLLTPFDKDRLFN